MTFKCTFSDKYEPNIQVITYFDADRGNIISTARSLCYEMFSTLVGINAKIEKL